MILPPGARTRLLAAAALFGVPLLFPLICAIVIPTHWYAHFGGSVLIVGCTALGAGLVAAIAFNKGWMRVLMVALYVVICPLALIMLGLLLACAYGDCL